MQPLTQPFYLFIASGKGWEIWKLKPEAASLFEDERYHLCVFLARGAANSEIVSPSSIVYTNYFYRKNGQVSFYLHDTYRRTFMFFYPLEGLDGTQGYATIWDSAYGAYARFFSAGYYITPPPDITLVYEFVFPTIDGNNALILPNFGMKSMQPTSNPSVPTGSIYVTSKNAVFAHSEGLPMNGKVVAPVGVGSGQVAVPRKKLKVTLKGGLNFWEEDAGVIEAPALTCGIWALPSDDPDAKLDGYNFYSLNDIDAELVEQFTYDFFEPQITIKVPSRDDKFLYVSQYMPFARDYIPLKPVFYIKTPNAEVVTTPADLGDYTAEWGNYKAQILSVIEGEPPPEQKNKDAKFNTYVPQGYIPKSIEIKAMTSYFNPSFTSTPSYIYFYYGSPDPSGFTLLNLDEAVANARIVSTLGGIEWIKYVDIAPKLSTVFNIDMPVGAHERWIRSDLSATDTGRGKETVKVLVWQPMWFSHSFTADPNYGDILATFGFKVTTIASPPSVEYIVSGFQVCSIWFQNLLKRLGGTGLKDVDKQLLRDCVASLDGFFGAIRITFHYDKQTGLIYMREWRLGVPFGNAVPLTTFKLQPYHEIRALKDFWSWSLYLDIIDTRTQTIVKRIRIFPTVGSWIVSEVSPSQPIVFTQRKSFANPLVGVNPSSPYTVDRNLGFTQIIGRNPHALISSTLTNINPQVYKQGNYPTRFYPLQASITSLRGVPSQYQNAAKKMYGSQVPVYPIQLGNLNAQPIYVAYIPITMELKAKRDVPYEIIAKWGVGVAIYAAGTQWATLLPQGLADLGDLLYWTVVEFWEDQP
jgi:hypothetical protein